MRNNIAVSNAIGGIGLEDYGQRGLLRGIKIGFNSLYGNEAGGITAPPPGKLVDIFLVGNVGWTHTNVALFPTKQAGLTESENLICERGCFADPERNGYFPARQSALDRHRVNFKAGWLPVDDFFGHPRKFPPKVGAVETAAGPMGR